MDCYFIGCPPCAQMDKEVYPNELVSKEIADHFIFEKVDVFKEKLGDTLNAKFAVSGFPTFLIFNPGNKYPVIYQFYFIAIYNRIEMKNQLSKDQLSLFCSWPDKVVNEGTSFDIITPADEMHKKKQ